VFRAASPPETPTILSYPVLRYFYVLYKKFLEAIEYVFDKEIIEIDEQSVRIERSGFLGLRARRVFLADNVKGINTTFSFPEKFNFLSRLPFTSSNIGAFVIWHGHGMRPFYNFGRGVSQQDAQNLLDTIYRKFPKYRYTGSQ
jgi:hypothetical protein